MICLAFFARFDKFASGNYRTVDIHRRQVIVGLELVIMQLQQNASQAFGAAQMAVDHAMPLSEKMNDAAEIEMSRSIAEAATYLLRSVG